MHAPLRLMTRCALVAAMALTLTAQAAAPVAQVPTPAGAGPVPMTKPATCANQGYRCPTSSTCVVINPAPTTATSTGGSTTRRFTAYRCEFAPATWSFSAPSCPRGLQLQALSAPPSSGVSTTAVYFCAPAPTACPAFAAGWRRQLPVMPLNHPAQGYTCGFERAL